MLWLCSPGLVMADLVLLISFPAPEDEQPGEAAREG
jgi:hypothetical protein